MKFFIFVCAMIASGVGFAAEIDLTGGTAEVISADKLQIKNVMFGNLSNPVDLTLSWNSVTNAFLVSDVSDGDDGGGDEGPQPPTPEPSPIEGAWMQSYQPNCTGAWRPFVRAQVYSNGTCYAQGQSCNWEKQNEQYRFRIVGYSSYNIVGELFGAELRGTYSDGSRSGCWKAIR